MALWEAIAEIHYRLDLEKPLTVLVGGELVNLDDAFKKVYGKLYPHPIFIDAVAVSFDLDEIEELTYSLSVEMENIRGETKRAIVFNFITHCLRRGNLDELIRLLYKKRPHLNWSNIIQGKLDTSEDTNKMDPL